MKRYIWSLAAAALIAACMQGTAAAQDNVLTEAEQEAGWKLLFDGQTLLGWTHRGGNATWAVEDGMLTGEVTGRGPGYIGTYDNGRRQRRAQALLLGDDCRRGQRRRH